MIDINKNIQVPATLVRRDFLCKAFDYGNNSTPSKTIDSALMPRLIEPA